MDVIKCDRVSQFIGATKALDSLHFVVKEGEVCAFLGLDHMARASLFNLIQGKERVSSGRLWVYGHEPSHLSSDLVGYAPSGLPFSMLSLHEILFFKVSVLRTVKHAWVAQLIAAFGLSSVLRLAWSDLSREVQYKALLVLSLLNQPSLLLVDMILDYVSASLLSDFQSCLSLMDSKMTLLFATQQLALAHLLAHSVCLFHKGKLLFYGTTASLFMRFGELRLTAPLSSTWTLPECVSVCVYEGARHWFVYKAYLASALNSLQEAGLVSTHIQIQDITVRDIIFQMLLRDRKDWSVF